MTRQHKPTSKAGEEYIKPHKASHKEKILEGLKRLVVGGTYEQISAITGLREDQVWKRMSDCLKDETVFDTGITRQLKSGLYGTVWQIKNWPIVAVDNPTTEKQVKGLKALGIKPFTATQPALF